MSGLQGVGWEKLCATHCVSPTTTTGSALRYLSGRGETHTDCGAK